MIRSFLAIDLPGALREEIERLQSRLRRAGADVKWTRPASVHLTLKFLGSVEEGMIEPLARSAGQAAAAHSPLTLKVDGTGVFPGRKKARVVWLGLAGDVDGLAALAGDIEVAAEGFGFKPEKRPFRPHLTLGRFRSGRGRDELLSGLDRLDLRRVEFIAREVVLFKSDLKPTGAVYTALQRLPLGEVPREEKS